MPLNVNWLGMNENNDGAMTVRFSVNACGKSAVQAQNLHLLFVFKEFRKADAGKFSFYMLFCDIILNEGSSTGGPRHYYRGSANYSLISNSFVKKKKKKKIYCVIQ